MEPDTAPRPLDHVERAHLRSPGDASHVVHRYDAAPGSAGLLERFWIPVWSVPPGLRRRAAAAAARRRRG